LCDFEGGFSNKNYRKSANELLKMKFFTKAKGKDYLKEKLLKNIPPLEKRVYS